MTSTGDAAPRSAEQEQPHLHGLDAVRSAALLLGIFLHACLSFIPGIGPDLWPISDTQKSTTLSVTMFVIHIFRMSVFFLIAGLLTRRLFHRSGLSAFFRNRASRILAPLALGWIVCFPWIVGIVLWALARANEGQLPRSLPHAMVEAGPNFLHLWFLYLLLWLYAIVLAGRFMLIALRCHKNVATRADRALRATISWPMGPLLLAMPIVIALLLITEWVGGMGVPTPGYTLVPPPVPMFIYLYVFVIGWMLDRQRSLLDVLALRWPANLLLGSLATLWCLLQLAGVEASFVVIESGSNKLAYAAAYGVALMCLTLAFFGAGVKYFSQSNATVRYVADASYWMYIVHLPVVMALQTALMLADVHWAIKLALINALTCAFLLITYHYGVRATWIGQLLNGQRRPRRDSKVAQTPDGL